MPATITRETERPKYEAPVLRMPDWGAAGWAGLISGALFMLCELALLPVAKGGNAWVPVRMVAAIIYGRQALPPLPLFSAPATPDSGVFFIALGLHYSLALIYLRVLSAMIYRLDTRTSIAVGAFFGLILYALNFYGFTGVFPWFAAARGWPSVVSNLVFGASAAALYKAFERREPLVEDEDELRRPRVAR